MRMRIVLILALIGAVPCATVGRGMSASPRGPDKASATTNVAADQEAAPAPQGRGGGPGGRGGAAAEQVPDAPPPRNADGRVQLGSSKAAKGYWEVRPG